MELKCKLKDLCHDLIELGVEEIAMDFSGIGLAVADNLNYHGIKVKDCSIHALRKKLKRDANQKESEVEDGK